MQFLRQEAKENIRRYIDEYFEYQKCLVGLEGILRKTWDIANNSEYLERDKLQAISVGMQAYNMKLDLLTNVIVVERAANFVDRHRGLMPQSTKVVIDDTAEPIPNMR